MDNSHQKARNKRPLIIAVDTKNLSLYTGGIAAFFGPLLNAWIAFCPQYQFILIGPAFPPGTLKPFPNCRQHLISWPEFLPRYFRHPFYDNLLFPLAIKSVMPDLIFTPYHDVRLPKGIPSVMMVHDTCLHDLPDIYPAHIRNYYLHMLKRNIQVASQILTVSETSKSCLQATYKLSDEAVGVVPNAIDMRMTKSPIAPAEAKRLRSERGEGLHIFYSGGSEHRKNIRRLSLAVEELAALGQQPQIRITGQLDDAWSACLKDLSPNITSCFHFLGRLSLDMLAAQYLSCDVVVYPTLCEGFGRVALEAMELGVPIACSDLGVLREVAGDYPAYFDPWNPKAIADAIRVAKHMTITSRHYDYYQPETVAKNFLVQMDAFIDRNFPCT